VIPPLTAQTADGKTIRAWDYKQKCPLAIVFLHADCPHCDGWLEQLAAHSAELAERDAVALLIYSETPPRETETMPPPFLVAADVTGNSQREFLGGDGSAEIGRVGVFVTDRYGDLFGQWMGKDADELPAPKEIIDTLNIVQMIC
jgi:hypothetical protein